MSKTKNKKSLIGWTIEHWDLSFYNCDVLTSNKLRKQVVHDSICISKKRVSHSKKAVKVKITIEEI